PTLAGGTFGNVQSMESQIGSLLKNMPAALQNQLAGHSAPEQMVIFILVYGFAPMFLILPLMVASVLAADSFAGEKERKTMEALLYTPTSDRELFVAKILGPWLAAIVISVISFILYTVMVDLAGWISMREILLPNLMWIALVFFVAPATAGLSLVIMVFASAKAQGFQDAYQTGGMVVLPLLGLVYGQIGGVMYFTVGVVLILGFVFWVLLAGLLSLASKKFNREQLMIKNR
ncbi:MAG: hypothetical protein CVU45_07850, partial [Chloroflexi bacterium HGW-Chloroflexi-7]